MEEPIEIRVRDFLSQLSSHVRDRRQAKLMVELLSSYLVKVSLLEIKQQTIDNLNATLEAYRKQASNFVVTESKP